MDKKKIPIAQDIKSATFAFVDYMYNECVINYNDDNLNAYINGTRTPNYEDICLNIVKDGAVPLSPSSIELITNFLYFGSESDHEVLKASIMEGIKEYANKMEVPFFTAVSNLLRGM